MWTYCYCTLGKRLESHIIRYFVPIPATCEHTLNHHRFTRGVKSVPVAPNGDRRSQKTPSVGYLRTECTHSHGPMKPNESRTVCTVGLLRITLCNQWWGARTSTLPWSIINIYIYIIIRTPIPAQTNYRCIVCQHRITILFPPIETFPGIKGINFQALITLSMNPKLQDQRQNKEPIVCSVAAASRLRTLWFYAQRNISIFECLSVDVLQFG